MRMGSVTGTRVARRMVSTDGTSLTALDDAHDPVGRHGEGIAAADDDVAHLGVGAQPRERGSRAASSDTAPSPMPTMRERVQKRQ